MRDGAAETDIGRRRYHNEDGLIFRPDLGLFSVIDSSGQGGAIVPVLTGAIESFFDQNRPAPGAEVQAQGALQTAIKLANLKHFRLATGDDRYRGAGATLVAALTSGGACFIAPVGDCRAYLLRGGALAQLTEDHSLINEFIRAGRLTPEEIDAFPHKGVVTRGLGYAESLRVDCQKIEPLEGDRLLLCSDGLHGELTAGEMGDILRSAPDPTRAARGLIRRANEAGGSDNITALVLHF